MQLIPVTGTWRNVDGSAQTGSVRFSFPVRVTSTVDDVVYPAGSASTKQLMNGSISISLPAVDDPNNSPSDWSILVEEKFMGGRTYYIQPKLSMAATGLNLADVVIGDDMTDVADPAILKGVPGGLAALDKDGDVVNASGNKVISSLGGGTAGPHAASHGIAGDDPVFLDASQIVTGVFNETLIPATIARDTEVTDAITNAVGGLGITVGPWTSYTPGLTAATANPNLGSTGAATGHWKQAGTIIMAQGYYKFSGTSMSSGTGAWRLGLPAACSSVYNTWAGDTGLAHPIGRWRARIGSTYYTGDVGAYATSATDALLTSVSNGTPSSWTPTAGDFLQFWLAYESA